MLTGIQWLPKSRGRNGQNKFKQALLRTFNMPMTFNKCLRREHSEQHVQNWYYRT